MTVASADAFHGDDDAVDVQVAWVKRTTDTVPVMAWKDILDCEMIVIHVQLPWALHWPVIYVVVKLVVVSKRPVRDLDYRDLSKGCLH